MVKIQVEIEDNLEEIVDGLKEKIRENFVEYLKDNTDMTDFENYYQKQGCDFVHESSDSCTPVYFIEIDGLFYLYGSEFGEAYKNAGIGNVDEDNHKAVCIYCYLTAEGFDYLNKLKESFEDWQSEDEEDKRSLEQFVLSLEEED